MRCVFGMQIFGEEREEAHLNFESCAFVAGIWGFSGKCAECGSGKLR